VRLLITGGSGYLGSQVLEASRSRHETFATYLSRPFNGGIPLDVRDGSAVRLLFDELRPDAVIHTAYAKSSREVIVWGSAHIAAAAHTRGARLVYVSTDVVFGGARGGYHEADVLDPLTDYGKLKAEAEQSVMFRAPEAVMVRTSLIYGLDGHDAHSRFVLDGISSGTPVPLFVDEYRCPILVGDLAAALIELVPGDMRGPLHVAGAERLNRYEFGALIARHHGYDTTYLNPTAPADLGIVRPKDCSLNCELAGRLLKTRLRGASEVLRASFSPVRAD
jgi:dTDP-4-dehydrorhamnose reductase